MGLNELTGKEPPPSRRIGRPVLSEIVRNPQRPLGPLSDYVVENLPMSLRSLREQRQGAAETMIQEVTNLSADFNFESMSEGDLKLAWMDLGFLEAAFYHSGLETPTPVKDLMDTCAARLDNAPILTYEGYVLINPLDEDPRLFLDEETGAEHELFFCQIHTEFEKALKPLFDMLMGLYDGMPIDPEQFKEGVGKMEAAKELMGCLYQVFSKEAFTIFRRYVSSNKDRQLAGASGAFSAAFPALDQILLDEALRPLPEEAHNPRLWPRKDLQADWYLGWQDIFDAKGRRGERARLLTALDEAGLRGQVIDLLHHLQMFRGKHI